MSTTIDHRVVEMRFDNKQFESGTKETMGTLKKLKEALKFPNVSSTFENLRKSANKVDLKGLDDAIEGVKLKFSGLEVAAITALSNIVNRAVDAGVQLAKSLSIDQIYSGFSEYELKMGSIQTIMASTGESLGTVNKYLQELNEYSDKTIYSFSDMTQNIGKFTNAGVKLEDAVKAIQGISNEAAVSGANANEASRAMYNFAQALSAGYIQRIDWRSIELANMGTMEFKQSLLDTAVAMGTVVKVGDKYQSTTTDLNGNVSSLFDSTTMFNDSLAHQWMTTDVLVQTLNNYSNDVRTMTDSEKKAYEEKLRTIGYTEDQIKAIEELGIKAFDSAQNITKFTQLIDVMKESVASGWAQTFELIFGDYEEAKQLWTGVNNELGKIIQESSNSRNELLRQWKNAGGRTNLIDAIANSYNALLSIINIVAEAFGDVFNEVTGEQLSEITKVLNDFTSKLKLSENGSKNLHDAFEGLFNIVKFGIDIFFELLGAIVPINKPVLEMGGGFLDLAGSIGRTLTYFTKLVRSSSLLRKGFDFLSSGFEFITIEISLFIKTIRRLTGEISKLEGTQKLIDSIRNAFKKLYNKTSPYINDFIDGAEEMLNSLFSFEDLDAENVLNEISKAFSNLADAINSFNIKPISDPLNNFKNILKQFLDLLMSNDGLSAFVNNAKEYNKDLQEAFTFDNLMDRVEKVMSVFGKFCDWIKNTLKPTFEDFTIGGALAAGGGLGIVYSMIKIANSLNITKSIRKVLDSVKGTLKAYQKEINANTILKIAGAIALLSGALVLLSFADPGRLLKSAVALALVAGVLLFGISRLLEAVNKGVELNDSLLIFSKGLSSTMKKLGRAAEIKALGSSVKDIAKAIATIGATIISLGIMYKKDKDSLLAGIDMFYDIAIVMGAMITLVTIASKLSNFRGAVKIGSTIIMISASLNLIILSLKTLFDMQIPKDAGLKFAILGGIFVALISLVSILALISKIPGGNELPKMTGTIIGLAAMLGITFLSLKILFDMQIPKDAGLKFAILGGIFVALISLVLVMAAAAKIAGGKAFSAGGTILALSVFLIAVVGSLFILTIIPADKMRNGAIALGGILLTLGVALAGAGKISNKDASKAVLSMAITVGVITAALAILTMIPFEKLKASAIVLGGVLLIIAANFLALSKVKSGKALPAALAMIGATIVIATALGILAHQPWEGLLSAAAAMSITLLAFSKSFEMILSKRWDKNNVKKIGTFLLLTLSVLPIGLALGILAHQPWEGLLSAAAGISATLLALSACFAIIAKVKVDPQSILSVLAGAAALVIIASGIDILAKYDPVNLIATCVSLSVVLLTMAGLMAACAYLSNFIGHAMVGVLGLGAVIIELGALLAIIGGLAQIPGLKWIINEGGDLLEQVGSAIGGFFGGIVSGVLGGISSQLPQLGSDLSEFMVNLIPFIALSKMIDAGSLACVGFLAGIFLSLTAAEVINGISSLFNLSIVNVAIELSRFMVALIPFITLSSMLKEESMRACNYLADMIIKITAAELIAGIGRFFGLSGNLTTFGSELESFGPHIAEFAKKVKDVKPEAVQGAAAAAGIMAEMANKLPGQDGLVQKIFGNKSLKEFGIELESFGPHIAEFAETVKDVKRESVVGAASAAGIMAEMANKLPNSGGLASKILGDNNISDFGEELAAFAPDIVYFANKVKDIKPESVNGVSAITSIMSMIANRLPNTEGWLESIFGGGKTTISDFGEQLSKFGEYMIDFSDEVSEINSGSITRVIKNFRDLADLVSYVGGIQNTDLSNFTASLSQLGTTSVSEFINSFTNINSMITINNFSSNIIKWFAKGLTDEEITLESSLKRICNNIIKIFKINLSESVFKGIGSNIVSGMILGIESKGEELEEVSRKISRNAVDASKEELDERSPSKVMFKVGRFFSIGLANGISDKIKNVSLAGTKAADSAMDPMKKAVSEITTIIDSGNFDMDPVIRPVVDLSDVQRGFQDISSLMNKTYDLSYTYERAMDASASFNRNKSGYTEDNANSKSGEYSKVEFNQYNYSPKALSEIEIYRRTKNQISLLKQEKG